MNLRFFVLLFLFSLFGHFQLFVFFSFLVRSSSTENICIGDVDLGGSGGIERDPSSRGAAASSSPNVQIESVSNKQRRDKIPNKGQQDEEEERGKIINELILKINISFLQKSFESMMVMQLFVMELHVLYPYLNKQLTPRF